MERFAVAVCVAAANRIAETPRDGDALCNRDTLHCRGSDFNPNHNIDPNRGLNRP